MITEQELQNRVEVMSAYWQGEEVEWSYKGEFKWAKCWESEIFQWDKYIFRVKPAEPKVIWLLEYPDGGISYTTEPITPVNDGVKYYKYIEVLEDE